MICLLDSCPYIIIPGSLLHYFWISRLSWVLFCNFCFGVVLPQRFFTAQNCDKSDQSDLVGEGVLPHRFFHKGNSVTSEKVKSSSLASSEVKKNLYSDWSWSMKRALPKVRESGLGQIRCCCDHFFLTKKPVMQKKQNKTCLFCGCFFARKFLKKDNELLQAKLCEKMV